jgi:hypothetical protein
MHKLTKKSPIHKYFINFLLITFTFLFNSPVARILRRCGKNVGINKLLTKKSYNNLDITKLCTIFAA